MVALWSRFGRVAPDENGYGGAVTVAFGTGLLVDRYEVGELLGRGGMGEVRRARDRRLERDVAIKFLRPDLAAQPEVRARFETEARNAARLTHPNVVLVLDSGEDHGQPFMVMECLPGRTLRDVLAEGPVPEEDVRAWADEILSALGAAHDMGVIHRDITPSNILITEDGRAKIADFGISQTAEGPAHTEVGVVVGTLAYLAPERLRGEPATTASDLYATGVVLSQMVADRSVDPALTNAIDAATAEDPSARPSSADAMRGMLAADTTAVDATAAFETAAFTAPITTVMPAVVAQRRVPRELWITILAAAAVGVLLLLVTDHSPGGEDVVANVPTTAVPTTVTTLPPTTIAAVQVQVGPAKPGKGHEKKGKHGDRD